MTVFKSEKTQETVASFATKRIVNLDGKTTHLPYIDGYYGDEDRRGGFKNQVPFL